jgi:hypothetical protein
MRLRPLYSVTAVPLVALATLAMACPGAPEQPDPRALAGCHFFIQDETAEHLALPWGVRLLDTPLEGWPAIQQRGDVYRATTLTGHDEVDFPFGYWIRTANDSLEIGYPAGGGLLLELATHNGSFGGVARGVGDLLPPPGTPPEPRTYPVELIHARCPDE